MCADKRSLETQEYNIEPAGATAGLRQETIFNSSYNLIRLMTHSTCFHSVFHLLQTSFCIAVVFNANNISCGEVNVFFCCFFFRFFRAVCPAS